jgi:hypothetical protein
MRVFGSLIGTDDELQSNGVFRCAESTASVPLRREKWCSGL